MKSLFIGLLALASVSTYASTDLRETIQAQASTVFATADSKVNSNQDVCLEFGKLLGLGTAYKIVQCGAPLENYINETVALFGESCKSKKLTKLQRNQISELSKSIFTEIKD